MKDPELERLLAEHAARETRADEGGGRARQARQARLGRLTARERIAALLDEGTFVELGRHVLHRTGHDSEPMAANRHPGDGIVCGLGAIAGREVAVIAHDPTVMRGAVGLAGAKKVCRALDLAERRGLPVITLADSDGARFEEGNDSIDAYGEILRRTIRLRGRVPQITLACGLCVGAAAYTATLNDWVAMVDGQSFMFITGPKVTRKMMGEEVSIEELGGAGMHAKITGACHAVVPDERAGIAWVKRLLAALTPEPPPGAPPDPIERKTAEIASLVPLASRRAYDMRKIVASVFDEGSAFELHAAFAANLLTVLARLGGAPVAVVASQPMVQGGCLDVDASRKGAHFVTWAGQRGLPVVTLVDVPGYMPGKRQEQGGIIPHGATLLTAYGNADVPQLCLIVRKCFGGATVLSFAADVRLALPTARVGPMGADAALEVSLGPLPPDADEETRARHESRRAAWLAEHDHAWAAAETGYVDQVVAPEDARASLGRALARLRTSDRAARRSMV